MNETSQALRDALTIRKLSERAYSPATGPLERQQAIAAIGAHEARIRALLARGERSDGGQRVLVGQTN